MVLKIQHSETRCKTSPQLILGMDKVWTCGMDFNIIADGQPLFLEYKKISIRSTKSVLIRILNHFMNQNSMDFLWTSLFKEQIGVFWRRE